MPTSTLDTNPIVNASTPAGSPGALAPELHQRFEKGYAVHKEEIAAVPDSALLAINLDIPSLINTVTGAYHNLIILRPRIVTLAEFDIARIDALETLPFALGFVHTRYEIATAPPAPLTALATRVIEGRDVLLAGLRMLERRKFVDASVFDALHGGQSYRTAALEALKAAHHLRALPAETLARSGLTLAEIDEATSLAGDLTNELGARDLAPAVVAQVARERQATYTLTVTAYDQARRAATYLLWNDGNVDEIVPSLYAGRGGRRRTEPTDAPPVATDVVVTPGAGGNEPAVPGVPVLPALDPRSPGMNPFAS
jgi:hypothetical protein